ncbi:hypothetical protein FOA52_005870 [Chlamydomonas sp. UWO 241]|nr:hypothetical protein FOA52_005870 [Chlamydomonas sp. UWO 241]
MADIAYLGTGEDEEEEEEDAHGAFGEGTHGEGELVATLEVDLGPGGVPGTVEDALTLEQQHHMQEAQITVAQLPADFVSYLATLFAGIDEAQLSGMLAQIGTHRLRKLQVLYADILGFRLCAPEDMPRQYVQLSRKMEALQAELMQAQAEAATAPATAGAGQAAAETEAGRHSSASSSSGGGGEGARESKGRASPGPGTSTSTPRGAAWPGQRSSSGGHSGPGRPGSLGPVPGAAWDGRSGGDDADAEFGTEAGSQPRVGALPDDTGSPAPKRGGFLAGTRRQPGKSAPRGRLFQRARAAG